jgi:phosphoglycolate phosphatase
VINMPRIAVSYGAHHIDRLSPYEPDLCLDHFPELLRWHRLSV